MSRRVCRECGDSTTLMESYDTCRDTFSCVRRQAERETIARVVARLRKLAESYTRMGESFAARAFRHEAAVLERGEHALKEKT